MRNRLTTYKITLQELPIVIAEKIQIKWQVFAGLLINAFI